MPHRTRPMAGLLLFTGLNVVLVSTITPVYDFVCFLPYWERRMYKSKEIKQALKKMKNSKDEEWQAWSNTHLHLQEECDSSMGFPSAPTQLDKLTSFQLWNSGYSHLCLFLSCSRTMRNCYL